MQNIVNKQTHISTQTVGNMGATELTIGYGTRIVLRAHQDNTGFIYLAFSSAKCNSNDAFKVLSANDEMEFDLIDVEAFDWFARGSAASQKIIVSTFTREV